MTSHDVPVEHLDLTLRPATAADTGVVAEVLSTSRRHAVPAMPPPLHSAAEDLAFITGRVADSEVWVAESEGAVVGYVDVDGDWLHSLYVHPEAAGRGVGTALVELVKGLRPRGFALWVFASNDPARRLYHRLGLVELEHTDGSANQERSPDLRMAWVGADPVGYLRGQIDEVDDDLAGLVARRAALTAAIQTFKATPGHAGRDHVRERAIAERLARRTPGIDVQGWQRIMEALITVSLDVTQGEDHPPS